MKIYFVFFHSLVFLALIFSTSCNKSDLNNDLETIDPNQWIDVSVEFSGFDIIVSDSRSSDKTALQANINTISLLVLDNNGNTVTSVEQSSTSEDFGTMSMQLRAGIYTFIAVANQGSAATITSATTASIVYGNPYIYSCVKSNVTVSGSGHSSVTMLMGPRRNATFLLRITDATPSDVESIHVIVSPSAEVPATLPFNPATGLTNANYKYERTVSKSTLELTTLTNMTFGCPLMLTSAQQNLSVKIDALSATDQVLYTRTLTSVPFEQGKTTTASGPFFSTTMSSGFLFDTSMENTDIDLNP